jgi:hypothetical protein
MTALKTTLFGGALDPIVEGGWGEGVREVRAG